MNAVRFIRFVGLSNAPQYFLALTKICGTEKVLKVLESVLKAGIIWLFNRHIVN